MIRKTRRTRKAVRPDIDSLLRRGQIPSSGELLDPAFRGRFVLGDIWQIGIVVPDVVRAAHELSHAGIGPFFVAGGSVEWNERGVRSTFRGAMALAYQGPFEIELLEGGSGSSFYSDAIDPGGRLVLHHVGILEPNLEEHEDAMRKAGFETAVRGRIRLSRGLIEVDFAYMDCRRETGIYVELIRYKALGMSFRPRPGLVQLAAAVQARLGIAKLPL